MVTGERSGEMKEAKDRLIVALDTTDLDAACVLTERLAPSVGMFKVGSPLFTAHGPKAVYEVLKRSGPPFLDLKFHDTPRHVEESSGAAINLGIAAFTVHALGGPEMMSAARRGMVAALPKRVLFCPTKIFAVTILTSYDYPSLLRYGLVRHIHEVYDRFLPGLAEEFKHEEVRRRVVELAKDALEAGLDGVVASPGEVAAIRKECGPDFRIAVAGVSYQGSIAIGHKRSGTVRQAIADGADYVIVGRLVLGSADPVSMVQGIAEEIASATAER